MAKLSSYAKSLKPSAIRESQIAFDKRDDAEKIVPLNFGTGNVSLGIPEDIIDRLNNAQRHFNDIIGYTTTQGLPETQQAFKNLIKYSLDPELEEKIDKLNVLITGSGSMAMYSAILTFCNRPGEGDGYLQDNPLMVIDPAYTNYMSIAHPLGIRVIAANRKLDDSTKKFSQPDIEQIKTIIKKESPGALVVIPYDNPSGQFIGQEKIAELTKICLENNIAIISDEAYRGINYTDQKNSSIWAVTDDQVPGIENAGIRVSIESASKVLNACGLRIGALVTDDDEINFKAMSSLTPYLCAPANNQYAIGAVSEWERKKTEEHIRSVTSYYSDLIGECRQKTNLLLSENDIEAYLNEVDAAIYSVLRLPDDIKSRQFLKFCSAEGKERLPLAKALNQPADAEGTLIAAGMSSFYNTPKGQPDPGENQIRLAHVRPKSEMDQFPELLVGLLKQFRDKISANKKK